MIRPFSLPPNPSLVAVLVIIRTRSGPRLVFHYPGAPEVTLQSTSWHFGSANSESDESGTSSDDDQTVASDNESTTSSRLTARPSVAHNSYSRSLRPTESIGSSRRTTRTLREDVPDSDEDDDEQDNLDLDHLDLNSPVLDKPAHSHVHAATTSAAAANANHDRHDIQDGDKHAPAEWEKLLGYPAEGLEMMLSPPPSMHKKRFEVMLDNLVFLGHPIFMRQDGSWRKKKKKKKKGSRVGDERVEAQDKHQDAEDNNDDMHESDSDEDNDDIHDNDNDNDNDIFSPPVSPLTSRPPRSRSGPHSYTSQSALSDAASEAESQNSNQDEMTMFHLVFVMNPPILEYHIRVQEMYDNVVKKFSKALRYEHARSNFLWHEAKKIQHLKAQAKENKTPMAVLWPGILAKCLLAKSIANIYTSIANSKIAHVSIGPNFDASLQIPQAVSTPYVPTPTEPQLPGLWLTTASALSDDAQSLSPYAALLLLEDKDTLLKEIEGDGKDLANPLAFFIRHLTPTKSLVKLSQALSLPLSDVQFLARHLIYWRRARAIPPLHIRDTYIVSPNCDMRQLEKATPLYSRQFSALPSLPKMLQNLSSKPIQYGYFIPSKDHKPAYMEILAWLLRGGWVTQLRTFAWVKVNPEVKAAVAQRLRQEYEEKIDKRNSSSTAAAANDGNSRRPSDDEESLSDIASTRKSSLASPRLSALLSPSRATSDAGSVSSGRTAIPIHSLLPTLSSQNLNPARSSAPDLASPPMSSSTTDHEESDIISVVAPPLLAPLDPASYDQTLVLSPHKASTEEGRWLAHIGAHLEDAELREHWSLLYKYFDGRRALEEIAAREGLKRSKVQVLLAKLEVEGVLYIVRHW